MQELELELELENLLCARFPFDTIEPVPKGEFGGDTLQRVVSAGGQPSGVILWEYETYQELERRLVGQAARRSAHRESGNRRSRQPGIAQRRGIVRCGRWRVGDQPARRVTGGDRAAPHPA